LLKKAEEKAAVSKSAVNGRIASLIKQVTKTLFGSRIFAFPAGVAGCR
jgi:hypothetical protein